MTAPRTAASDQVAELLADAAQTKSFSAARTAPASCLHLEVVGLGEVPLPVPDKVARQLCLIGRPAHYGKGDKTLLDRQVRDSWEVPKSRVKIDKKHWDKTVVAVLDRLRGDLGLPAGAKLEAQFHSMLVYAPGQFFLPHQDSEKDDSMVGTLVVTLPSRFTGGVLEVEHAGEKVAYRGSKTALSLVAFYGDCRHQVKPVKSGYRVVLTYNLVVRGEAGEVAGTGVPEAQQGLIAKLSSCLREHFAYPGEPNRLVYLLDHEYTQRGLGWSRLKGVDSTRAALLLAAAETAGCETVLALADVHESWSAYEKDRDRSWYGGRRSGWDGWDDDEDEGDEDSWNGGPSHTGAGVDYDLEELLESEVTLDSWLDHSGKLEKVNLSVREREVCASTPSEELRPYQSEYEGYMGNEGNTLDRWYHRGAVVAWPRGLGFAVRAEVAPSWALDTLSAQIRARDTEGAKEAARTLAPSWRETVTRVEGKALFSKALRVARDLDDPALAKMLLQPFRVEMVAPSHARVFGALVELYGESWAGPLVEAWSEGRHYYSPHGQERRAWVASLPAVCTAFQGHGEAGASAGRLFVGRAWKWLGGNVASASKDPSPSRREKELSLLAAPFGAMLQSASLVGAGDAHREAVALLSRPGGDLASFAVQVLRSARKAPSLHWGGAGLGELVAHCAQVLEARLARPARAEGDWSIEPPKGCKCELCQELRRFLVDSGRRAFDWPLAKEKRAHVHSAINAAELPVTHETTRQGRPYTLVLMKTNALFERERQARKRDKADLAWLVGLSPTTRRPA